MPAHTAYGYDLELALGIGRQELAGRWDSGRWGQSVWVEPDTALGDWVDVTCDVPGEAQFRAGSDESAGVVVAWEAATCDFNLDGPDWDPWTGPYAGIIGPGTPVRWRWRRSGPFPPPNLCTFNTSFEDPYTGAAAGSAVITRETVWAADGVYSIKVTPAGSTSSAAYPTGAGDAAGTSLARLGMVKGGTYTVSATIRVTAAQTGTLHAYARSISMITRAPGGALTAFAQSPQAPNVPGVYRLKVTFTVPTTGIEDMTLRLYNGSTAAADLVWWDALAVQAGTTDGVWPTGWEPLFTGSVADGGWQWDPRTATAAVACTDPTAELAGYQSEPGPYVGAGDTASARVTRILDAASWPANLRQIVAGGVRLVVTDLGGTALEQLQAVADTDLGLLWVRRDGRVAYRPQGRANPGPTVGRLVVCPDQLGDLQVVDLSGANFAPLANSAAVRGGTVPAPTDDVEDFVPPYVVTTDEGSIARFRTRQLKLDLLHDTATEPSWSATVGQLIVTGQAWPSMAPREALLGLVSEDDRVPGVLWSLEPDSTFEVVDTGGRIWICDVAGWDVTVSWDGCSGTLYLNDITAITGGVRS
jgi:hypothetical protein